MNIGYIKLYRKVTSSFVWTNSNMLKLWMLCLMKASHKESRFIFNGQEIEVSSGEFVTGRAVIEKEFNEGVPRDQQVVGRTLWRWLKKFENEEMLSIKSTTKYSVISINKWDEYQGSDQQVSNNRPSSVQQVSTYKNEKNDKNDKNIHNNNSEHPAELIQSLYGKFPTGILQSAIADWLQTWPREMLCFAIQTSFDYGKEFNGLKPYINRILENWSTAGIDTLEKAIEANNQFKQRQSKSAKTNAFNKKPKKEDLPDHIANPVVKEEDPDMQAALARRLKEYEENKKKEKVE